MLAANLHGCSTFGFSVDHHIRIFSGPAVPSARPACVTWVHPRVYRVSLQESSFQFAGFCVSLFRALLDHISSSKRNNTLGSFQYTDLHMILSTLTRYAEFAFVARACDARGEAYNLNETYGLDNVLEIEPTLVALAFSYS